MFYDFSRTLISSKLVREEEKEHATSGLRVTQLFLGRVTSINSQSETRIRKVFRNAIRAGECKQNISLYIYFEQFVEFLAQLKPASVCLSVEVICTNLRIQRAFEKRKISREEIQILPIRYVYFVEMNSEVRVAGS